MEKNKQETKRVLLNKRQVRRLDKFVRLYEKEVVPIQRGLCVMSREAHSFLVREFQEYDSSGTSRASEGEKIMLQLLETWTHAS